MSFMVGENVWRYRILGQLGQGGMATVYHAYDANLDRDIAIKVMHQAFNEDPNFLARFKREAQIVARLRHPHIVTIYEFDEHKGQPYLVMEFIEGETLKARLARQGLTLEETVRIMTAVGDALTYAHEQGVLHRDIKPSNILMDKAGTPYLTDFGLARMVQAGESTLSKDMLLGTPQYISPEQAQGIRNLGPATDVYSLGIVLYQVVVGRVPFSADTPYAIVHDHIYKPLPLPSQVNPQVPPPVERVLLKALAKDPASRFKTAKEMVVEFKEAVAEASMEELPPRRAAIPPTPAVEAAPEVALSAPSPPPRPVIPAVAPTDSDAALRSAARRLRRRRTLWMLSGLGGFIFTCLLGLFVAVVAVADPNLQHVSPIPFEPSQEQSGIETPLLPAAQIPTGLSIEEARQLVSQNPDDPVAHFALFLAQLENGERLAAQETAIRAVTLAQASPMLIAEAARQAGQLGYQFEALSLYMQAASLSADNPAVRNEAGHYIYTAAVNATRRDILVFRRAASNYPDSGGIQAMLARALLTIGNLDEAGQILEQALSLAGAQPETHLVLGEWYVASGERTTAIAEWRYALTASDAMPWVVERATVLLAEHNP